MKLDPLLNCSPEKIQKIHIMGICGTGMAALAGMLQQAGFQITGSDNQVYPPMSTFLAQQGIIIIEGYKPENLAHKPDLVIVGNVITRNNPEAVALAQKALPYLSFPQALAKFFISTRTSIVVAGTHGKTTTCSLLASALTAAGLDPSFMIGGIVQEFNTNYRLGKGEYFISEGDEYDTAFFDKESKFLHYLPKIGIITSIEFDHADIFENLDQIKSSFKKFISRFPEDGLIIANLDDNNVREVLEQAPCSVQSYGDTPSFDWSLRDIETQNGLTSFAVHHLDTHWDTIALSLSGRHNCLNSLAVVAVMHNLGLDRTTITRGLKTFGGVKRRQEVRGVEKGITVIDDFAHHPTAVKETLKGLKETYKDRRLIAVFEPRTNSSRRSIFQKDYITSFEAADCALIREPIPLINVDDRDHFSSEQLAEDLARGGIEAYAFPDATAILEHLLGYLQQGDIVAILSNGGFDNIHQRLLDMLRE